MTGTTRGLAIAIAGLTAIAGLVAGGVALLRPEPAAVRPAGAERERCLDCHARPGDDPGGAHAAAIVGCAACHLGDPTTPDAILAHRDMEPEPGALRTVTLTCGRCHEREAARVATSLMATGRGLVAVDRWAFGELPAPDGDETLADVLATGAPTPAQDHLRRLCAGCHLNTTKDNRDDAIVGAASGCSACHSAPRPTPLAPHPEVSAHVPDARCLGCHSRSGRIALSYAGLAEVDGPAAAGCAEPVELYDGRPACRMPADVHAAAGLACVDCHVHSELMGDGVAHRHEEEATEVRCESCHGPDPPSVAAGSPVETTWAAVTDAISRDLLRQRGETRPPEERVRLGTRGTPLWNLRPTGPGGAWVLTGKLDGRSHPVARTPDDAAHTLPGHERLTCAACHDTWAPRCATCHTRFEPSAPQWDFGLARETRGRWIEEHVAFDVGPPALGVDAASRIRPAVPAMVAELDATTAGGQRRSLRLYALARPHTTQRRARSCASCHTEASALGLGEGSLDVTPEGVSFHSTDPGPASQAAATDRWTTLFAATPGESTHVGARSLDAEEQRRVLRVGACLACHEPTAPLWADLRAAVERLRRGDAPGCRGGIWSWMDAR
ncbi:MAG: hypothetical protein H6745_20860 [Deltaproteobacteria bacterium]|nr:hypothetical protein [Deltaproteobacteria bacterium]